MRRPTGSRAHRLWKCPASEVLPHVESDDPKPAAIRGTDIHAYLEIVGQVGVDEALARSPEELRPYLACIDVDSLPVHLATEVAFAWNWRTRRARELGRNMNRDYAAADPPLSDDETPLTVDVCGIDSGEGGTGIGYVGDYKTGRTRYPRPAEFGQTLLGALCVRDLWKATAVRVELLYVGFDGDAYRVSDLADDWILDDFADEWAAAMDLRNAYLEDFAAGKPLPLRQGPHCDHCPAFKNCNAKMRLVRSLPLEVDILITDQQMRERERLPMTREDMALAWRRCEQLKSMIGSIQTEIAMSAAREPIDLGDGSVLGVVTSKKEFLIGEVAAQVVEQWYGEAAMKGAIKIGLPKENLRKVVVDHKKPDEKIHTKKGTGALDRITEEIRRRNGIELRVSQDVKVHFPKRITAGDE